jgi:hypothetical protein
MNTEYTPDSTEPTAMIERQPMLPDGVAAIRRRRRRNQVLTGAAAGVAFAVLVVGCLPRTTDSPQAATGPLPAVVGGSLPSAPDGSLPGSDVGGEDELDDAAEDAFDQQNPGGPQGWPDQTNDPPADPGDDGGGGGGSGDGEIPPGPEVEPHPCDALPADGSSLVAHPDPVVLASNVSDGEFQVTNCSDGDVDYTVAVNPKVTLDDTGGTVLPGESVSVGFHIDFDAYGDGAIQFKIKVTEPNHSQYVDVSAYNPLLGWEAVGSDELTAGEGVGGCSNQCIVSALLQYHWQSPNADLDVVTDTPAKIRVYVSQNPPLIGDDGLEFDDVAPMDTSAVGMIEWTARLQPLEAGTNYYIMVTATDADGEMSTRIGSFRTITPLENPDGIAQPGGDSGCAVQCITSALLSSGDDFSEKHLAVTTHTPALMQVSVSRDEPTYDGSVPSFTDADVWMNSGLTLDTSWSPTITGLLADTTYHIIVRAEDDQQRTSYRVGQFHTAKAPTFDVGFTLVGIRVHNDGDDVGKGEVSFGWAVGDADVAYKGESKVDDGDWVTFSPEASYWPLYDVSGALPTIRVAALERDFAPGFCSAGIGVPQSMGQDVDCGYKWNVASSGIVLAEGLGALTSCTEFGLDPAWDELRCMALESVANGDDYPVITAIVAVQVQPS